jgi:2'-5' RNA ligase
MTTEVKKPPVFLYAFAEFENLKNAIVAYAETHVPKQYLLNDPVVRKDPIERDPHVTVFFKVPSRAPSQRLKAQFARRNPFDLQFGEAKVFEIKDKRFDDGTLHSYDVVYIEVLDNERRQLTELHSLIGEDFETKSEHGEVYTPHVTVCYQKPGTGKETAEHINTFGYIVCDSLRFTSVHFKEFRTDDKSVKYTLSLSGKAPAIACKLPPEAHFV